MRPLKATLRIQGDELDPAEITRLLGVTPTAAGPKGERITGKGEPRTRVTGTWSLSLELPASDHWPLEQVLTALLAALPSDSDLWTSLGNRFTLDVFLGLFMTTDNQGFHVSPVLLSALATRHWQLSADIYAP
jgi:hypothetical protein